MRPSRAPSRTHALRALVAATALASCHRIAYPPPIRTVEIGTSPIASDGRSLVFVDRAGVAVRVEPDGATRRVTLAGRPCAPDARFPATIGVVAVAPGARTALVFGTATNIEFDLFGHSGRHVAVGCVVDFDQGSAEPVERSMPGLALSMAPAPRLALGASGRAYVWDRARSVDAVDVHTGAIATLLALDTSAPSTRECRVAEVGTEAVVACAIDLYDRSGNQGARSLEVRRFDVVGWPPVERARAHAPIELEGMLGGLALAPDGSAVAYWGEGLQLHEGRENRVALVDARTGNVLARERHADPGAVTAVGALPGARGALVAEAPERPVVRWLRAQGGGGVDVAGGVAFGLVPLATGERYWLVGLEHAMLMRLP